MQQGAEPVATAAQAADGSATRGFVFALSSYLLWGVMPLYLKLVSMLPSLEVVAHRILWSVPVAGVVLVALGRTADVKAAFRSPRTLAMAAVTAAIIAVNWGVYVWAIAADQAVETALGYYINPLVTVALGAALLGERLSRVQLVAVGLAVAAVTLMTIEAGGVPWVSLALAFSFAAYGYLRKTLPIGPSQGFFLEVLILSVPGLFYILWLEGTGRGHFFSDGGAYTVLLMLAGPATAVPLLLYAFGAKLLRISTIGIMQYVSPTIVAVIAVFVFGEPFGIDRIVAFVLIWTALALYTWSMFFGGGKAPTAGR